MNKKIKNPKFKGRRTRKPKPFSVGGMLVGPSHDNGGIPALVDGTEPIEVEGGEFIINKQTVDSIGVDFLHKLNSTDTTHHTGGYNEGQLPSPSQFKDGGKINNNRRNKMARGRRAPRRGTAPAKRQMARGGRTTGVRKMADGGGMGNRTCGGPGQMPCGGQMGGYRSGGRTKPVRKFHQGSRINPNHSHMSGNRMSGNNSTNSMMYTAGGQTHMPPNKGCQMHSGDATTCNNHPSCTYNYSTDMCH